MRALYLPAEVLNVGNIVIAKDEAATHLSVVRVRLGEHVLLLNGKGVKARSVVIGVEKKSYQLKVEEAHHAKNPSNLSVAIALPKKEAFEEMLRIATELGVSSIYPLSSQFSQFDYTPSDRTQRVLESALIQSNNPYMPIVHAMQTLDQFLSSNQAPLYFFNSNPNVPSASNMTPNSSSSMLILIGPEGGFSASEENKIYSCESVKTIHLNSPIMRSPTALAAAVGFLMARN